MKISAKDGWDEPLKEFAPAKSKADSAPPGPGVLWNGHLYDYSGYAKANREILFRVSNSLQVSVMTTGLEGGFVSVSGDMRRRIDYYRDLKVRATAPLLRFFGPDYCGDSKRHRICWTMMETYKIHPDMVGRINRDFDELWTPTKWNRDVFLESGVRIPTRVMPLGVDPLIYRPIPKAKMPNCTLITGPDAGMLGTPDGFTFITVGVPSFRKGWDIIVKAFDKAFNGHNNVNLVLAITHTIPEWVEQVRKEFVGHSTRIWLLEGCFNEHEMATIYNASHAYVSASRGEGWNLPATEAAACGLPVIVPMNTSHPEVCEGGGLFFRTEGYAEHPEANKVSGWYKNMPFSVLGNKSITELGAIMGAVFEGGAFVAADRLRAKVISTMTWDRAAAMVAARLMEVQG